MIHISLEEFLRIGTFGPLRLGLCRAEVEAIVGLPDSWKHAEEDLQGLRKGAIWKYRAIELHYAPDADSLILIYSDNFAQLAGDSALGIDPWIIQGGIARQDILQALEAASIAYQQVRFPHHDPQTVTVITTGGVSLHFIETHERYGLKPGLYALAYGSPDYFGNHEMIPLEYWLIGHIEHFWDRIGVVKIRLLPGAQLEAGQEIAFYVMKEVTGAPADSHPFAFLENFISQVVQEPRVEVSTSEQPAGTSLVTVQTSLTKQQARKGVAVYLISR